MQKTIKKISRRHYTLRTILQIVFILAFLYTVSLYNFALFHTLAEMFNVIIAFAVFIVAWNSRHFSDNNFLLLIGIAYFFVGIIDLTHTISHPEFTVVEGANVNLSQQLRIFSWFIGSVSLLFALLMVGRRIKTSSIFLGYLALSLLVFLSIFYWKNFPEIFTLENGYSSFKIWGDHAIEVILLVALILLISKRKELSRILVNPLSLAIVFQILSVYVLSPYTGDYSVRNIAGHLLRLVSFFLLYKAMVEGGLMHPYSILFKNLIKSRVGLRNARDRLEEKVKLRTAELKKVNLKLSSEKKQLVKFYEHIGVINRKISLLSDLHKTPLKAKDKEGLANYILTTALNFSSATTGILYKYDEKQRSFHLLSGLKLSKKEKENINIIPAKSNKFLRALVEKRSLVLGDFEKNSLENLNIQNKIRHFIMLPLEQNNKIVGAIFLGFRNKKSVSEEDFEFHDIFSLHASQALSNVDYFKQKG